jgi:hypothetical protein
MSMSGTSRTAWTNTRAQLDRRDPIADGRCTRPSCVHQCIGDHEATWIGRVVLAT